MWCLGTWVGGGLGFAGLVFGLDDLRGLCQPEWIHDSLYKWHRMLRSTLLRCCLISKLPQPPAFVDSDLTKCLIVRILQYIPEITLPCTIEPPERSWVSCSASRASWRCASVGTGSASSFRVVLYLLQKLHEQVLDTGKSAGLCGWRREERTEETLWGWCSPWPQCRTAQLPAGEGNTVCTLVQG